MLLWDAAEPCTTLAELSDASIAGAAACQLVALFAERSIRAAAPFATITMRKCSFIVPATFSRKRTTSVACAPMRLTRENEGGGVGATLVSWYRGSIHSRKSVRWNCCEISPPAGRKGYTCIDAFT